MPLTGVRRCGKCAALRHSDQERLMNTRSIIGRAAAFADRHAKAIRRTAAALTFTLCIVLSGVTLFTNQVFIVDGENVICSLTASDSAADILAANGIEVGEEDIVSFDGFGGGTGTIEITRAFDVKVTADGETKTVLLADGTVADALDKADIDVGSHDLINVGLNEKVNPDTDIVIRRVQYEEVVSQEEIPYEVTEVETANLKKGVEQVAVYGAAGTLETVTRNTYIDGELCESVVVDENVVEEPVEQIVNIGTAVANPISITTPSGFELDEYGIPLGVTKVITGRATAYYAPPGAITSTGVLAAVGRVAVDPKLIPYGTKMYIVTTDGQRVYGYAEAADTGYSCRVGDILVDLYMNTYDECVQWGSRQVNIYILG